MPSIWYLSQETLRNPRIVRVGNLQFFHGIVQDIHGNVKGCLLICRRASAPSQSSKTSAESYCIPRIVEGQSACSSRKGGIIIAVLYVAVDCQRQRAKGVHLRMYLIIWIAGQAYGVRLCCYVSVIDMFLMVSFPMHRTALLATSGGLDKARLTACSSRELYWGTCQGRNNGQTDRQMEGHIEMHSQLQMDPSYVARPFPVLRKRLRNTGRKGAGPTRLQMSSNISLACYTQLHVTTYCRRSQVQRARLGTLVPQADVHPARHTDTGRMREYKGRQMQAPFNNMLRSSSELL